jgi:hypothetical protein
MLRRLIPLVLLLPFMGLVPLSYDLFLSSFYISDIWLLFYSFIYQELYS